MRTGRTSTLTERRYADVRLAVSIAARDLFLEHHTTAVTVEAIAQRAGVSERTFYRHFPSRADLMTPLFQRSARRLVRSLHAARIDSDDVVPALVDALTEQMGSTPDDWRELLELLVRDDGYRLRWESTENQPVDALADWLSHSGVHSADPFARRVTALSILTSSRAAYTEWILQHADTGTDRLRLLHFRSLETIASGWRPR